MRRTWKPQQKVWALARRIQICYPCTKPRTTRVKRWSTYVKIYSAMGQNTPRDGVFIDQTVAEHVYLDILQNFAVPQIPYGATFQQKVFLHITHCNVTTFLNCFSGHWNGRKDPCMASEIKWSHTPWFLHLGIRQGLCVSAELTICSTLDIVSELQLIRKLLMWWKTHDGR